MEENSEKLSYPIGRFKYHVQAKISDEIGRISALPALLRSTVSGLTKAELEMTYRAGGWTLLQVIHHLPDSHMNAYIRFKLAVTEQNPVIRPYEESSWAECLEAKNGDVNMSLNLLESLHLRWVEFLKNLSVADFERTYHHPELGRDIKLKEVLSMYAWHGEHHLAHITQTL